MNFKRLVIFTLLLAGFAMAAEIDVYTEALSSTGGYSEMAVVIDVTNAQASLGSYTATVTFDASAYKYIGFTGNSEFSSVINEKEAANGKLVFAAANARGANGKVQIAVLRFEGEYAPALGIDFSAMAAASTFDDLLPLINSGTVSDVDDSEAIIPQSYNVSAYPNPFNPTASIRFEMPETGRVKIDIFNMLGQKMATLVEGTIDAGVHTARWDATSAPAGSYIVRMNAENFNKSIRIVLVK